MTKQEKDALNRNRIAIKAQIARQRMAENTQRVLAKRKAEELVNMVIEEIGKEKDDGSKG